MQIPLKLHVRPIPQLTSPEPFRVPEDWQPIQGTQEPSYLYHEQDKTSDFFKYVVVQNWKKWFKTGGVACDPFFLAEYWSVPN